MVEEEDDSRADREYEGDHQPEPDSLLAVHLLRLHVVRGYDHVANEAGEDPDTDEGGGIDTVDAEGGARRLEWDQP